MRQHHQEFDTRPLAEGLHELADQAADAPGLFDAVAAGARRRSARVRAASAALSVGGVLAVAAGVAAWPSGSGTPRLAVESSLNSNGPVQCASSPPTAGADNQSADSPKHLPVGTPVAATLCVYKFTDSGTTIRREQITGSALKTLTHDLARAKSAASATCTAQRVNPEHELILRYPRGSVQTLVIDLSGCGTVGNGNGAFLLPTELRRLVTS